MTSDVSHQVPNWVEQVRKHAAAALSELRTSAGGSLDDLAAAVARRSSADALAPVDLLQQDAAVYQGAVEAHFAQFSDGLIAKVGLCLAPLDAVADGLVGGPGAAIDRARADWNRELSNQVVQLTQYTAGWVEGGGIALALMTKLQTGEYRDATAHQAVLSDNQAFVFERLDSTVAAWLDTFERQLTDVVQSLDATVEGPPPNPRRARLQALLSTAAELKVRIRNVPPDPSDRYLDKLENQLQGIAQKRGRQEDAAAGRRARLKDLTAFAATLRVRVKASPENPSDAWLDKMEAKLTEVAVRKGIALPNSIEPPTREELRSTVDATSPRASSPGAATMSLRLRDLIERAAKAELELGTIPEDPPDSWLEKMEAQIESTVDERKQRRKAERRSRDADRRAKLKALKAQAEILGLDLGAVPPVPSEAWLNDAEKKVAAVRVEVAGQKKQKEQAAKAARRTKVQTDAESVGIDLGKIPPNPDETWLEWAEARVAEADSAPIAVESDGTTAPTAFLVLEEGTVQEQVWPVGDEGLSIGRSRGNVVQIRNDAGVSRKHAILELRSGSYFLKDLNSTKGILVNAVRVAKEEQLQGGERIQVGDTTFVFRMR